MDDCATHDFTGDELGKLATQYREAEKFIGLTKSHLDEIQDAARVVCDIAARFDILTAVGEQLTFVGKRLGWPREHCVCVTLPVLGFVCTSPLPGIQIPIAGNCEGASWLACGATGEGKVSLDDDAVYRRFLLARRYQMLGLYDIASLQAACREMWGSSAVVHDGQRGTAVVAPGRVLTAYETSILPLMLRVLPFAPGIRPNVHFGAAPVLGFGAGWAGNCVGGAPLCPVYVNPYGC
jgi:hypothetical protein